MSHPRVHHTWSIAVYLVAVAIAASNGVLLLVGGMALSDALSLGESAARRTLLAIKGCTMVLLDGDSNCIGGRTQSWMGGICNNQLSELKSGIYPIKKL